MLEHKYPLNVSDKEEHIEKHFFKKNLHISLPKVIPIGYCITSEMQNSKDLSSEFSSA